MTTPLPSVAALFRDDLQAGERDELQPGERDLQDAPQIPGTQEHCQEPPGRYIYIKCQCHEIFCLGYFIFF